VVPPEGGREFPREGVCDELSTVYRRRESVFHIIIIIIIINIIIGFLA